MPVRNLQRPAELARGNMALGLAAGKDSVVSDQGDFGAGLIRGFAVITKGEALGHGLWIDPETIQQTAAALNALEGGVKSRFTHPGLSADGMGKYLGRAKNATVDGDVVRADLHLAASAHKAPDGNLADYVMSLASEDPQAFGSSIVFERDREGEQAFMLQNGGRLELDEDGFPVIVGFKSPDPENIHSYPHARLARLRAVDIVDNPAANPGGLFRRGDEIADEAESLLSFALGLSPEAPAESSFDIHPDRVQSFVTKFLERHGLTLARKDQTVTTTNPAPAPAAPTREQFAAELNRYITKFGEAGSKYFADGKSWEQALEAHADHLEKQLAAAKEETKSAQEKLASIDRGEAEPVSTSGAGNVNAPKKSSLASLVKLPGAK